MGYRFCKLTKAMVLKSAGINQGDDDDREGLSQIVIVIRMKLFHSESTKRYLGMLTTPY
jgi:hypothetical protein